MNDRVGKKVLAFLAVFTAGIVISTSYVVFAYRHTIFFQDYWHTLKIYDAYLNGKLNLKLFWEQNGNTEHRIPVPRILFLLDYLLTHGTGLFLISLNLLIQGLHSLLLRKSMEQHEGLTQSEKTFFSLLATVVCFWLLQSGNLIWGFQITWFLNGLAASFGAFWACRMGDSKGSYTWKLAAAALGCFVATYSLANGLFMCGVLGVVIWKSKQPRALIFWIAFSLALAASYLIHYHSPDFQPSWVEAFSPGTLRYLLVYLGNPVSRFSLLAGSLAGLVGLSLFVFFAWRFLVCEKSSFYQRFAFSQITYVFITAVVTSVNRHGFGVIQATSSRYYTPILLFWFFQVMLVYSSVASGGRAARWIRVLVLGGLCLFVVPVQLGAVPERRIRYLKNDEASLAFITGVQDTLTLNYLRDWTDSLLWENNEFLRDHRLSVYREPWTLAMGADLADAYRLDSNSGLSGEARIIRQFDFPLHEGYFVAGKIFPTPGIKNSEMILFADSGKIVGCAKTARRECPGCFSGYVKGLGNRGFEIFALENASSRQVCKVHSQPDPQR